MYFSHFKSCLILLMKELNKAEMLTLKKDYKEVRKIL